MLKLETPHLYLIATEPSFAEDLFELFKDPESMRFMPTEPHKRVEQTREALAKTLEEEGTHHFSAFDKATNELIGFGHFLGQTKPQGLGYFVKREHWGKGFATEICTVMVRHGFETLGFETLELWIDERNTASQRVASKPGFRFKGRIPQKYAHRSDNHVMLTFGLSKDEWLSKPSEIRPEAYSLQPVLMVHSVAESLRFYTEKLGFKVDFVYGDPPEHAAVSMKRWTGTGAVLQLTQVPGSRELSVSSYLYILMNSQLDAYFETLRKQNVRALKGPTSHPYGMREFVIKDNSGHVLEFATYV